MRHCIVSLVIRIISWIYHFVVMNLVAVGSWDADMPLVVLWVRLPVLGYLVGCYLVHGLLLRVSILVLHFLHIANHKKFWVVD